MKRCLLFLFPFFLLATPAWPQSSEKRIIRIERQRIVGKYRGPELSFIEPQTAPNEVQADLYEHVLSLTEQDLLEKNNEKGGDTK